MSAGLAAIMHALMSLAIIASAVVLALNHVITGATAVSVIAGSSIAAGTGLTAVKSLKAEATNENGNNANQGK